MSAEIYEKLGLFYLGKAHDLEGGVTGDELVLYDSKDLTTHGLCVGMTGSGKTGLCLGLLEEAAMDGIPVLAIDPKGDLANLLLTFPDLAPADFEPWVDPGEAEARGLSTTAYAAHVAARWRTGLAEWGQDGARIARLRAACDFEVYTPGSDCGIQLAVLRTLAAPGAATLADREAFQDHIEAAVSGLLLLLGVDADPLASREHVLLSAIVSRAWRSGQDLELADLIRLVQDPGVDKIGVMPVDAFFPAKDRFALAMRMNSLLASPSFETWTQGATLDIPSLLYTGTGKPRVAIISIAHLSETERMFFLAILLNEFLAWVRQQPGTASLRAILYMDEIYGYFPPTANPPTKKPMLTLLKQARAYGVGVMLATQNPVDLDYKGLANIGTWFIGRLQTERDKLRMLEGLEGASGGSGRSFDRGQMEQTLAGLGERVFLMYNAHDDGPTVFRTRWVMSYLRGPLTKTQLRLLRGTRSSAGMSAAGSGPAAEKRGAAVATGLADRPVLPPGIIEGFQAIGVKSDVATVQYRPALMVQVRLHFVLAKAGIDEWIASDWVVELPEDGEVDWGQRVTYPEDGVAANDAPLRDVGFAPLTPTAANASAQRTWTSRLKQHAYEGEGRTVWYCPSLNRGGRLGQGEAEFRGQLRHAANEQRDESLRLLRRKYATKLERTEEQIRKVKQRLERESEQYSSANVSVAVSLGATLLGALFGRRSAVSKAGTTIRGISRSSQQRSDVVRAESDLAERQTELADLEDELRHEIAALEDQFDPLAVEIEEIAIVPRKGDISIGGMMILWQPYGETRDHGWQPLFARPSS